ncbi:MAG: hypothetical protein E6I52_29915 [Chloroflexi bacterium]|nr:MAG: hypothetical protein E6I52_29915 [Chloroflexota bacterium]
MWRRPPPAAFAPSRPLSLPRFARRRQPRRALPRHFRRSPRRAQRQRPRPRKRRPRAKAPSPSGSGLGLPRGAQRSVG